MMCHPGLEMEADAISEDAPSPRLASGQAAFAILASLASWALALFGASLGFVRIMVEYGRSCPGSDEEKAWAANAILLGCCAAAVLLPQTLAAGAGLVQGIRSRPSRLPWVAIALAVLCAALGSGAQMVPATMAC